MRPVNLHVTIRAIGVLRVQVMLRAGRLNCADVMRNAVTGQTKLRHAAGRQQPRIGRAVRRVTRDASFGLHRRMFISEWTLLVRVTLNASRIGAGRQSRLLEFKTAMRIVAITALHRSFENLVMERQIETGASLRCDNSCRAAVRSTFSNLSVEKPGF